MSTKAIAKLNGQTLVAVMIRSEGERTGVRSLGDIREQRFGQKIGMVGRWKCETVEFEAINGGEHWDSRSVYWSGIITKVDATTLKLFGVPVEATTWLQMRHAEIGKFLRRVRIA